MSTPPHAHLVSVTHTHMHIHTRGPDTLESVFARFLATKADVFSSTAVNQFTCQGYITCEA